MADVIRLLPDTVANQIAAGEVVQRPASVVKELLENSVDAGATKIELIVKDAGRTLIQVVDNGKGMSVTDARMCFERHATSKIRTTEDIFSIHTKGFRGEALASIAAVAQVELKTQLHNESVGTMVKIEGGEFREQQSLVTSPGTNIRVKNLFYNVPARRKFLKSNTIEFRHILDEFHRVALAHESIAFSLIHNEEEIYKLRATHRLQRISDLFGKKTGEQLLLVEEKTDWIDIHGFVGKVEVAKKNRNEEFFFVNQRYFRSNYFHKAVMDAYEGLLPDGHFPSYFIYLSLDPEKIDVNIHPTKTEVKFEDEPAIFSMLLATVKKALGVFGTISLLDVPQLKTNSLTSSSSFSQPPLRVPSDFNPFRFESQGIGSPSVITKSAGQQFYQFSGENLSEQTKLSEIIHHFDAIRLENGLWIIQQDGLFLIHPYRIHQSVLANEFQTHVQPIAQQLLFAIEYPLDERSRIHFEEFLPILNKKGFDVSLMGDHALINAIPDFLPQEKVMDVLDALLESNQQETEEIFWNVKFKQAFITCTARKSNEWTQSKDIQALWQDFLSVGKPNFNPVGKKNFEVLDPNELLKKLN